MSSDRSYTAEIGVHRHTIFSLYFSPTCEILIDKINKLDFNKIREIIATKPNEFSFNNIYFNLDRYEIIFQGIELSTGKYITGSDNILILKLPATKEEILYILSTVLHMFAGEEPVHVD
jgi:hypothetical protein